MIGPDDVSIENYGRHIPSILGKQLVLNLVDQYLDNYHQNLDSNESRTNFDCLPSIQRFHGAMLFVDISGFTVLSQKLNVDELRHHINGYFKKILDIVFKYKGEVIKFAGDALFIIWQTKSTVTEGEVFRAEEKKAVTTATACGMEINATCSRYKVAFFQENLHDSLLTSALISGPSDSKSSFSNDTETKENFTYLNVHAGVSVGTMAGIDVGANDRWEYLLLGEPLVSVAKAESEASVAELVLSPQAHRILHPPPPPPAAAPVVVPHTHATASMKGAPVGSASVKLPSVGSASTKGASVGSASSKVGPSTLSKSSSSSSTKHSAHHAPERRPSKAERRPSKAERRPSGLRNSASVDTFHSSAFVEATAAATAALADAPLDDGHAAEVPPAHETIEEHEHEHDEDHEHEHEEEHEEDLSHPLTCGCQRTPGGFFKVDQNIIGGSNADDDVDSDYELAFYAELMSHVTIAYDTLKPVIYDNYNAIVVKEHNKMLHPQHQNGHTPRLGDGKSSTDEASVSLNKKLTQHHPTGHQNHAHHGHSGAHSTNNTVSLRDHSTHGAAQHHQQHKEQLQLQLHSVADKDDVLFVHFLKWIQSCLMDDLVRHVHEADRGAGGNKYNWKACSRIGCLIDFAQKNLSQLVKGGAMPTAAGSGGASSSSSSSSAAVNHSHGNHANGAAHAAGKDHGHHAKKATTVDAPAADTFVTKIRNISQQSQVSNRRKKKEAHERTLQQDSALTAELRSVMVLFIKLDLGSVDSLDLFIDPERPSPAEFQAKEKAHLEKILLRNKGTKISFSGSEAAGAAAGAMIMEESYFESNTQQCLVLELEAFDEDTTYLFCEYLMDLYGLTDNVDPSMYSSIHEISGGNPLYIYELSAAFVDRVKANPLADTETLFAEMVKTFSTVRIEEVIFYRFDQLDMASQLLIKMAAVVCANGSTFTTAVLSSMMSEASIDHHADHHHHTTGAAPMSGLKGGSRTGGSGMFKLMHAISSINPNVEATEDLHHETTFNLQQTIRSLLKKNEFIKISPNSASHTNGNGSNSGSGTSQKQRRKSAATGGYLDEATDAEEMDDDVQMMAMMLTMTDADDASYLNGLEFEFRVHLEQVSVYALMLNDQKESLHDRVASYLESRLQATATGGMFTTSSGISSSDVYEEGFHWEHAAAWSAAMSCYFKSASMLEAAGAFEESYTHLTAAYRMLNAMRRDAGVNEASIVVPASFQAIFTSAPVRSGSVLFVAPPPQEGSVNVPSTMN